MMRFQTVVASGLTTFLVVPAVTLGGDEIGTLKEALTNTARALEILAGIENKLDDDEPVSAGIVLAVTEPSILDARRRDERLNALRNECSLLQTELDLLENAATAEAPSTETTSHVSTPTVAGDAHSLPPVHTGIDEATRNALRSLAGEETSQGEPRDASATVEAAAGEGSPETEEYSADPVGQARACYRAKRYAQGFALLEKVTSGTQALYWRARCLEKLDRLDEAATDLRKVIEQTSDGFEKQRAQTDLEFIEWKKGFLEKLGDSSRSEKNG